MSTRLEESAGRRSRGLRSQGTPRPRAVFSDDRYTIERDQGTLVAIDGGLIDVLLWAGATSAAEKAAIRAFAQTPSDWDDDYMVGTLSLDVVQQVSSFLSSAPLEQWVEEHRAALTEGAHSMGYDGPFDDAWACHLLRHAHDLAALFSAAAVAREAVIMRISG